MRQVKNMADELPQTDMGLRAYIREVDKQIKRLQKMRELCCARLEAFKKGGL